MKTKIADRAARAAEGITESMSQKEVALHIEVALRQEREIVLRHVRTASTATTTTATATRVVESPEWVVRLEHLTCTGGVGGFKEERFPSLYIRAIKYTREVAGLGLGDAKGVIDDMCNGKWPVLSLVFVRSTADAIAQGYSLIGIHASVGQLTATALAKPAPPGPPSPPRPPNHNPVG